MRLIAQLAGGDDTAYLADFRNIDEELRYLRKLVSTWRMAPQIRDLTLKVIRDAGAEQRDKKGQALAIGTWIRDNIYYVHELPERFQTPGKTLKLMAGDCDDSTTLACSMMESIGIPSSLVCMSLNGQWVHIFPAAVLPDGLLPLDSTMRNHSVLEGINPSDWAKARGKDVKLKLA